MKIGLHLSCYQSAEFIDTFFQPWLEYKKQNDLLISVGHVCFKEFQEMGFPIHSEDQTHTHLANLEIRKVIDFYQFIEDPLIEAQARTRILEPLLKNNVDVLWLAALDECYQIDEINKIIDFISKDQFIQWYRLEFRNLTFSDKTYIRGFKPPRIFFNNRGYKLFNFFADDELLYKKANTDNVISYLQLPSKQIPFNVAAPLHYSWLDNEKSYYKLRYQQKRWGKNECSFDWQDGHLCFSKEFHKKYNIPIPELCNL